MWSVDLAHKRICFHFDEVAIPVVDEMGIADTLPTRDIEIAEPSDEWLPDVRGLYENMLFSERLTLDGLVSVWHPE